MKLATLLPIVPGFITGEVKSQNRDPLDPFGVADAILYEEHPDLDFISRIITDNQMDMCERILKIFIQNRDTLFPGS